ncbi:hypothetical protein [Bacillus phage SBSphiJ6]|nr:hypothetical protein [Bacillus phage SBSphiJ6]
MKCDFCKQEMIESSAECVLCDGEGCGFCSTTGKLRITGCNNPLCTRPDLSLEFDEYTVCTPEEATHVRVIDDDLAGVDLTFGEVYEYLYDDHPSEETHYIIQDNGVPFYDFECVIDVTYLKQV